MLIVIRIIFKKQSMPMISEVGSFQTEVNAPYDCIALWQRMQAPNAQVAMRT
jgi:hypothetical protein